MSSFLDDIQSDYGTEPAAATKRVLEAMGLPDPARTEYIEGNLSKFVFMSRYGLLLRVGLANTGPEHDLILKPLRVTPAMQARVRTPDDFLRDLDITIELLPGVEAVLKDETDGAWLAQRLIADGISFADYTLYNGGYLKTGAPDFPDGLPIIIDRGAVCAFPLGITPSFNNASFCGVQEKFYAPLHQALASCWPENKPLPIGDMKEFMTHCAAEIAKKERGESSLLSNDWAKNTPPEAPNQRQHGGKSRKALLAAAAYEQHLMLG